MLERVCKNQQWFESFLWYSEHAHFVQGISCVWLGDIVVTLSFHLPGPSDVWFFDKETVFDLSGFSFFWGDEFEAKLLGCFLQKAYF